MHISRIIHTLHNYRVCVGASVPLPVYNMYGVWRGGIGVAATEHNTTMYVYIIIIYYIELNVLLDVPTVSESQCIHDNIWGGWTCVQRRGDNNNIAKARKHLYNIVILL